MNACISHRVVQGQTSRNVSMEMLNEAFASVRRLHQDRSMHNETCRAYDNLTFACNVKGNGGNVYNGSKA